MDGNVATAATVRASDAEVAAKEGAAAEAAAPAPESNGAAAAIVTEAAPHPAQEAASSPPANQTETAPAPATTAESDPSTAPPPVESGTVPADEEPKPPLADAEAANQTNDPALAGVVSYQEPKEPTKEVEEGGEGEESGAAKRKRHETDIAVDEDPAKRSKADFESGDETAQALEEAANAAAAPEQNNNKSDDATSEEKNGEQEAVKAEGGGAAGLPKDDDDDGIPPVPPSTEGTSIFGDNDVLSGRGGGTNVHPGNRNFRDLINMHRRAYLKARKNDKPAISRAIVRAVRESNGRFLRKDDKTGLWFEIGDDAAREKTSQALRQRAPEMRKLLFDTEREEARLAAQEHLRQQRILLGMHPDMMGQNPNGPPGMIPGMPHPGMFVMAAGKNGMPMPPNLPPGAGPEAYQQMFNPAAMYAGGMNRYPGAGGHPPPAPPAAVPAPVQPHPPPPPPQQAPAAPSQPLPLQPSEVPIATATGESMAVAGEAAPGEAGPAPPVAADPSHPDPTECTV